MERSGKPKNMFEGELSSDPFPRQGAVWVRASSPIDAGAPFGGYKKSGIGRETHKVLLEHYSQLKNILINLREGVSGMYDVK